MAATGGEGQNYQAEDFSKKSLADQTFLSCTFVGCNFTESVLYNTKFGACTFRDCNLSLPKLDGCRFQEVLFENCKIVGAEFFKCQKTLFSPRFNNCQLRYCNFADLTMKNFSFAGSKLHECHFTNTWLSGADFGDTDLSGTLFHNCDLSRADFSTATHYDIDPRTNKVKKAKFSLPEVVALLRAFDITIV